MAKGDNQKNINTEESYDESFDFEKTVNNNVPTIRISAKSIVFNKTFLNQLNATKIRLGYNHNNKTIRIRAISDNEKGVQINHTKIPSSGFLKHYGLEQYGAEKKGIYYNAKYDEKEKAFYVKLD